MDIVTMDSTPLQLDCHIMRTVLATAEKPATKKAPQENKQSFATRFLNFASQHRAPEPVAPMVEVPLSNPAEILTTSAFLRIVTAKTKFSAPASFVAEIERSTKKKPPASAKIRLLFSTKDEADAGKAGESGNSAASLQSIFAGLIPGDSKQGRVCKDS